MGVGMVVEVGSGDGPGVCAAVGMACRVLGLGFCGGGPSLGATMARRGPEVMR